MRTEGLLRQVWGRRGSDDSDRVRTVVKKLRVKLGDDADNPAYIFNEHGVGYRFAAVASAPARVDVSEVRGDLDVLVG